MKATAVRLTEGAATVRVGATAYAPSDFVAQVQTAVAGLAVPTEFSVPGSAAEVTAKLVSGAPRPRADPSRPPPTNGCSTAWWPPSSGGVAVRFDDPLAAKDLVSIEELRDRDVVIDFARPNPVMLAGLTRALNARGVTRIVRTTNQFGGELEMAAQVSNRHLVAVVPYAPESLIGKIFSPPDFTRWCPSTRAPGAPARIALAWVPDRLKNPAEIEATGG